MLVCGITCERRMTELLKMVIKIKRNFKEKRLENS